MNRSRSIARPSRVGRTLPPPAQSAGGGDLTGALIAGPFGTIIPL